MCVGSGVSIRSIWYDKDKWWIKTTENNAFYMYIFGLKAKCGLLSAYFWFDVPNAQTQLFQWYQETSTKINSF